MKSKDKKEEESDWNSRRGRNYDLLRKVLGIITVQAVLFLILLLVFNTRLSFYTTHFYLALWTILMPLVYWQIDKKRKRANSRALCIQVFFTSLIILDLVLVDYSSYYISTFSLNLANWCLFAVVLLENAKQRALMVFPYVVFFYSVIGLLSGLGSPYLLPKTIPEVEKATEEWLEYGNEILVEGKKLKELSFYRENRNDKLFVSFADETKVADAISDAFAVEKLKETSPISKLKTAINLVGQGYFEEITFNNQDGYIEFYIGQTLGASFEAGEHHYCIKALNAEICEDNKELLKYWDWSDWSIEELSDCLFYHERIYRYRTPKEREWLKKKREREQQKKAPVRPETEHSK